jgi:hypothetical protein
VADPYRISEGSEVWVEDSGPYTVAAVALDASEVALTAPLTVAGGAGGPVVPGTGAGPAKVWVAEVVLPDAVRPIEVPLTVHDLSVMPEGVYDPPVTVTLTDDLASIEDLPGQEPTLTGAYLDPETQTRIDEAVAGGGPSGPPEASPEVDLVAPGNRSLMIRVPVQDRYTILRYEVATDLAFTQIVHSAETRSNLVTLSALPPDTNLYVRVTAFNDLGTASPGPTAGPYRTLQLETVDVKDLSLTAVKFKTTTHLLY